MRLARRSDRRSSHLYGGYEVQEAGLERRSTISHPRVGPHDLVSLGLPLSRWRASRLIVETRAPRHCPASSAAYRAEADPVLWSPLLAVCQIVVMPPLARIEPCRRSTR